MIKERPRCVFGLKAVDTQCGLSAQALFQAAIPAQPASYDYGSVRSTSISTRVPQVGFELLEGLRPNQMP